jgi:hypothetical protein
MKFDRLRFYLLRLKTSSPRELMYRIKQLFLVKRLKKQVRRNQPFLQTPDIEPAAIQNIQLPTLNGHIDAGQVQEILDGFVFSLNTDLSAIETFERKTREIYFDEIVATEKDPDIRAVWEPARLQHIMLLYSYLASYPDADNVNAVERFATKAVHQWIIENPFLKGPHYISAMECGLRTLVFLSCLKRWNPADQSGCQLVLDSLYQHGWWISNRLSLYSSLGNHTVAECVGLIFAGAVFKHTQEGNGWIKTGCDLLSQEVNHQILEDGGPAEQSLNYHRFVLDLYWLAIDFIDQNKLGVLGAVVMDRLDRAEGFLTSLEDNSGRLPSIGDSDDGHAVAPGLFPMRAAIDDQHTRHATFSETGYTVIKGNNTVIIFDHGALGMGALYNHGHADALSVSLSVGDKEMLVDPGTYRYNGCPLFRKYFKGTRAHNTITVDDLDQAVQETGFIWRRPYKTRLLKRLNLKDEFYCLACHDGYTRIKLPVMHYRSIYSYGTHAFLVHDRFSGRGEHDFELNYHLHPDAVCSKVGEWWQVKHGEAELYISLYGKDDFSLLSGQKDPILGWYSHSYGALEQSSVLSCSINGDASATSFISVISNKRFIGTKRMIERLYQNEKQVGYFQNLG